MTRTDLNREFVHACREYRVDGAEMLYGHRKGRPMASRIIQLARWTFMWRALRAGARVRQVAELLQMSERNIRWFSSELRRRGLLARNKFDPTPKPEKAE